MRKDAKKIFKPGDHVYYVQVFMSLLGGGTRVQRTPATVVKYTEGEGYTLYVLYHKAQDVYGVSPVQVEARNA